MSLGQCSDFWGLAHMYEHTHTVQHTHPFSEDHDDEGEFLFFLHICFWGEVRFSLFAVSVEEGGSMTCKDTPLRKRSHMGVLQWLSDPDESPSTVPALILMATPFSWSGRLGLTRPARPSLDDDPCGDAAPGAFSESSLWRRLRPFLSTMGESCFFFRIPAQDKNKVCCLYENTMIDRGKTNRELCIIIICIQIK